MSWVSYILFIAFFVFSCQSLPSDSDDSLVAIHDASSVKADKGLLLIAGDYYELFVGVDESNYLTAFYQSKYADPSCCFFIHGSLSKGESLVAYNPFTNSPPVEALFSVFGEELLLKIRGSEVAVCDPQLFDQVGYPIVLDIQKKWCQVRIAKQDIIIYSTPNGRKNNGSINKGQVFGVLKEKNGWIEIESIGQKKTEGLD